jgi:hypothetical protein
MLKSNSQTKGIQPFKKIQLFMKVGEKRDKKNIEKPVSILTRKCDTIVISGRKEKCKAAMEVLESLIPITVEIHVPIDLHRYIIGQRGCGIRKIIDEFDVNIQVSKPDLKSDIIYITGLAENVEKAKTRLQERVKALQIEIEDRALRKFKLMLTVDPKYHSKIIGHKGLLIAQICTEYDVAVHFPVKETDERQDQITITGYKSNTRCTR